MSYSVAADWKLAMWPPSSELSLFARRMIASAFQRMIERKRCSMLAVTGRPGFLLRRNRVLVRRGQRPRDVQAVPTRLIDQAIDQQVRALLPSVQFHCLECVEPFAGLRGIGIVVHVHGVSWRRRRSV
jgi:hypothetical protein